MGSLFRSEDMSLCQLYLQAEAAYACVSELGELGLVQFKDLNQDVNAFQRKFVSELRRCEEMERQLRFFERELKNEGLKIIEANSNPEAPAPRDMVDLEATYENLESELKELNASIEALRRNHLELKELQNVLKHTEDFFREAASGEIELNQYGRMPENELAAGPDGQGGSRFYLGFVAGVLPRERLEGFMRLLWFSCRGNVFIRHSEIEEPLVDARTGEKIWKVVFIAFFQGEQLKARVKKVCEGYKATLYPCSEVPEERREVCIGVLTRLQDLETVLQKSLEQKVRLLSTVAQNWATWHIKVLKIKAIYHTMNMFHAEGKNYIAECFVPTNDVDTVQLLLNRATESSGSSAPSLLHPVQTEETMPTYHRTNKFTGAFQSIIDAYGVATYKEVNPAPFTIITFPFLFSVMFGDFGHGTIMFLFGLWMVIRERQLYDTAKNSEMFGIIYAGRYIVLLMGAFSIYSGFLYNDAFSKSVNIFGSAWTSNYTNTTLVGPTSVRDIQFNSSSSEFYDGTPYPFGVDPVWQMTRNKITFTNSFKKKISIIFGVVQMLVGVLLSIGNHVYFKQYLNILCDFFPQLIFLLGIFGYLCALVFAKWVMFTPQDSDCAPNILIGFINMFLMSYPSKDKAICSNLTWFTGQKFAQIFLVILAVACAIWMLLSKPIIQHLIHLNKRRPAPRRLNTGGESLASPLISNTLNVQIEDDINSTEAGTSDGLVGDNIPIVPQAPAADDDYSFGESFIHQAIHTIEYCLGCVSHTASYLRLWALSLAHSQLSEVLWNMVMRPGLKMNGLLGAPMIFVTFAPFACLTVAILLLMEGLSAFLHTLRLHWVEFQSKFYRGEGILFQPFSFKEIMEKDSE